MNPREIKDARRICESKSKVQKLSKDGRKHKRRKTQKYYSKNLSYMNILDMHYLRKFNI